MTDTSAAAPAATAHPHEAPTQPAPPASGLGDPFPVGLAGFGTSALMLAFLLAGVVNEAATILVLCLALATGWLVELVAGILCLVRGGTFPGMVFVVFSGFWLSYALLLQVYAPMVADVDAVNQFVGVYLLIWGIVALYMLLAGMRTNLTTIAIFGILVFVFLLAGISYLAGSDGSGKIAGYLLIVDSALALYASAAIITNTVWEKELLPVP